MTATVDKSFVLLLSLIASGFLLCATQVSTKETATVSATQVATNEMVIGIHLGTTYSSVAVFKDLPPSLPLERICQRRTNCTSLTKSDFMELVPDELGSLTTPSCVTFTASGGVLIGEPAKNLSAFEGTICGSNPLIGKRFDDPDVQLYIKTLPYNVVNIENKPRIKVNFEDGSIGLYSPEHICSHILWRMKQIAETYTRKKVEHAAVLIHPRYYSDVVSQHIKTAGKIAGLEVAYVKDSEPIKLLADRSWIQPDWKVLVFHLGSSAFDVKLYNNPDETPEVIVGASGDANLGGQTLETRVVDYFINLIKIKYKKDISKNSNAMGKLRIECEKAKISLSRNDRVMVKIEFVGDDGIFLFEEPLTRAMFEELNIDLFDKMIDLVKSVIIEGGIEFNKGVDDIILVGGNTHIPKIQHMLKELFGSDPIKAFKPDEALAFAANHMAFVYSKKDYGSRDVTILNSLTLGIETFGGFMVPYLEASNFLPGFASGYVTTYNDGQTTIEIKLFEGERPLTKHCHYIATLVISDLPSAPRGVIVIKVLVEVDLKWNIRVTVEHEDSKMIQSFIIPDERRLRTPEKVIRAHSEYREFYKMDAVEMAQVREAIKTHTLPQSYNTKFAIVAV